MEEEGYAGMVIQGWVGRGRDSGQDRCGGIGIWRVRQIEEQTNQTREGWARRVVDRREIARERNRNIAGTMPPPPPHITGTLPLENL